MHRDGQKQVHFEVIILFAAVFWAFFLFTYLTPLIADDYNYSFGYSNGQRIHSLHDIWNSMMWHRMLLNGRVFSHGWLSLVLMFPRWFFAAMNASVAVFLSWTTLGFLRDCGCERPVKAVACLWMLLWICMPGFGQVFFWTAGACNYFWGAALSWFIIWKTFQSNCREYKQRCSILFLVLPAFAAGAWSEHISFSMLIIIFLFVLWKWHDTRQFPWPLAVIFLSGCSGYLFLMFAPATKLFQRLHDAGDPTEQNNLSRLMAIIPGGAVTIWAAVILIVLFTVLFLRGKHSYARRMRGLFFLTIGGIATTAFFACCAIWQDGIYGLFTSTPVGFLASLSLYLYALSNACKDKNNKDLIIISFILTSGGLGGFSLFLFGEYLPVRGFCAPVLFFSLSFVLLSHVITVSTRKRNISLLMLVVLFSLYFCAGVSDIISVHHQATKREAEFHRAADGDKKITTKPYSYRTKYTAQFGNPDLSQDAEWPNGVMADYYDVIRIIVED